MKCNKTYRKQIKLIYLFATIIQARSQVRAKKLTAKQIDKLRKANAWSNSDDITEEFERILNSRNRKSKSDEGDYCDEENESKSEFNDKEALKRIEELDKRIYEIASSNDDELRRLHKEQFELEMKLEDMSKTPRERELEKQLDLQPIKKQEKMVLQICRIGQIQRIDEVSYQKNKN